MNNTVTIVEFKDKGKHLERRCINCCRTSGYAPRRDYKHYFLSLGKTKKKDGIRRFTIVSGEYKVSFQAKDEEHAREKFTNDFKRKIDSIKQQGKKK